MNEKEIARLEQRKFGNGKQAFALREDGTLLVTLSKGGNIQHFCLSLIGWDSEPAHEKNGNRLYRVTLKVLLPLICIPIVGVLLSLKSDVNVASALMMCFVLLFSWGFLFKRNLCQTYDVLIFRNPMTGGQIVLHNNMPNEKEFSSFVVALKNIIKKYPYIIPEYANTAVADLREFARLRDDGVLTNEEFEEAKRKLLSTINTSSNMGFRP